jgi:hypothetical protein
MHRQFDHDRRDTLVRLLALTKKHQILAFLSALRLHRVQAKMDLRQALEAGSAAAYAIANPGIEGFLDIDAFGIMDPSQGPAKARYRWLAKHYPEQSDWIKQTTKAQINEESAHANVISGDSNFRIAAGGAMADTPFFDVEDEHFVKIDPWLIGRTAVILMQLFHLVSEGVARDTGRSPVEFRADFPNMAGGLAGESNALLDELKATDRFRAAMQKREQRAKAKSGPNS